MISTIIIIANLALCLYAAASDIKRLEIDNWVSIAIALSFIAYGLTTPVIWGAHIAVMVVVLIIGFLIHRAGIMGGGDIKLLTALSLWAGIAHLPALLMVTSLAGAVVALATVLLQKEKLIPLTLIPSNTGLKWVDSARAGESHVAYGIAIACGAAVMFTTILHTNGGL